MDGWNALLGRIEGWIAAVTLVNRDGPTNTVEDFLLPEARRIVRDAGDLLVRTEDALAPDAVECAQQLLGVLIPENDRVAAAMRVAVQFAVFAGAFRYYQASPEASWVASVERAFLHLDRLIVVDQRVREDWQNALESGETAVERLGGVHLLLHGLWAFKSHADGERTDLVLGDRLVPGQRAAAGTPLVLTEWKVAQNVQEAEAKVAEALVQARRYSAGSLAGFELRSTRYLVTVGTRRIELILDRVVDGVRYCHVHVAVDPEVPSAEGRRVGRSVRGRQPRP